MRVSRVFDLVNLIAKFYDLEYGAAIEHSTRRRYGTSLLRDGWTLVR
jgi:hypothetical protein